MTGGLVVWAALRFGVLAWLGDEKHPARPVMEALSWIAGIIGLAFAVAALVVAIRQERRSADADTSSEPETTKTGRYLVELRDGKGVQVGDHNTQTNDFGA
ncbi:RIP homotypic interaction motif-containing protein [Actinophytocola oryzae]|uniref:RIP homotypic interaction motif-containing protein n=1 Tax=Actinophytocola oryzae TaxID=502181 RepID=UPI001063C11B|nr:RIP homotypic interaction motif-containing protein [Actinophytocola oryzae]